MKILMLGWEYPPAKSGGLGTACYGLTKELAALGQDIIFVSPIGVQSEQSKHLDLVSLGDYQLKSKNIKSIKQRVIERLELTDEMKEHITYEFISSLLAPYLDERTYQQKFSKKLMSLRNQLKKEDFSLIHEEIQSYEIEYKKQDVDLANLNVYGANLLQEVHDYALKAERIAMQYDFDIIVAHDWMTFEAASRVKKATGKPLCVHIHATEIDRTGINVNQFIYDLERLGLQEADLIVANSILTKQNCVKHYGIDARKIIPVYLATDKDEVSHDHLADLLEKNSDEKTVLFLGRITMQKGPEYFIRAAAKTLKFYPNVKFIMAGSGEKLDDMQELAKSLYVEDKILFPGFLKGDDLKRVLKSADLFVLSSISEPFGLVVMEAIKAGVPCIVSKTSGVAEILNHVLKVDFWDTQEMANQIVNVLEHDSLRESLKNKGYAEAESFTWNWTAKKTLEIYDATLEVAKKGLAQYA